MSDLTSVLSAERADRGPQSVYDSAAADVRVQALAACPDQGQLPSAGRKQNVQSTVEQLTASQSVGQAAGQS